MNFFHKKMKAIAQCIKYTSKLHVHSSRFVTCSPHRVPYLPGIKIICGVRHYVGTHVSHGTHEADSVGVFVYFTFDGIICDVVYVQGTQK